jgi:hypothetical protein
MKQKSVAPKEERKRRMRRNPISKKQREAMHLSASRWYSNAGVGAQTRIFRREYSDSRANPFLSFSGELAAILCCFIFLVLRKNCYNKHMNTLEKSLPFFAALLVLFSAMVDGQISFFVSLICLVGIGTYYIFKKTNQL